MSFLSSLRRTRRHQPAASLAAVPAGGAQAIAPVRFADPIAIAARAQDSGAVDVMWFGGVTFRAER